MAGKREYTAKEMVQAIEAEDGVVRDVAERLGCSRMTVYRYRDRYKTVEKALEKNRTDLVYEMRDRLKDQARDEEISDAVQQKAILKLLEVFDEEIEWSDKERKELSDRNGDPLTIKVVNEPDGN